MISEKELLNVAILKILGLSQPTPNAECEKINSILFAKRDLTNCTIYVYPMPPCCRCASAIIQSGISTVITLEPTKDVYERWGKEFELSYSMYQERGINLLQYSRSVFEECCKEV